MSTSTSMPWKDTSHDDRICYLYGQAVGTTLQGVDANRRHLLRLARNDDVRKQRQNQDSIKCYERLVQRYERKEQRKHDCRVILENFLFSVQNCSLATSVGSSIDSGSRCSSYFIEGAADILDDWNWCGGSEEENCSSMISEYDIASSGPTGDGCFSGCLVLDSNSNSLNGSKRNSKSSSIAAGGRAGTIHEDYDDSDFEYLPARKTKKKVSQKKGKGGVEGDQQSGDARKKKIPVGGGVEEDEQSGDAQTDHCGVRRSARGASYKYTLETPFANLGRSLSRVIQLLMLVNRMAL